MTDLVDYAVQYAISKLGCFYIYGANGPNEFDCSAFVQSCLRAVGKSPKGDCTAQSLYEEFMTDSQALQNLTQPRKGSLVFYGSSTKDITHVSFGVDFNMVAEAGSGTPATLTPAGAIRDAACVRVKKFPNRGDVVAIIQPSYS